MDELVTHALLRRRHLNKDGKVKGKCTALWERILPGRQKGDGKGRNTTAASKNREEAMLSGAEVRQDTLERMPREAGRRPCDLLA